MHTNIDVRKKDGTELKMKTKTSLGDKAFLEIEVIEGNISVFKDMLRDMMVIKIKEKDEELQLLMNWQTFKELFRKMYVFIKEKEITEFLRKGNWGDVE